jgi:hypothetical protein
MAPVSTSQHPTPSGTATALAVPAVRLRPYRHHRHLDAGGTQGAPGGGTTRLAPLPASTNDLPATDAAAQAAHAPDQSAAQSDEVTAPQGTGNVSGTRLPAGGSSAPHVIAPPSGSIHLAPAPPLALAMSGSGSGPEAVAAIAVRVAPESGMLNGSRAAQHVCTIISV